MEIESPSNSPYYLPNKNAGSNPKLFQQGSNLQQGRQMGINQSQNFSGNLSNLSVGNNLSLGPINTPNAYGQPNRLNQNYNQNYVQQPNAFYNNYNQQNYNPQKNKGPNFQNNNFNNNNFQAQNFNNNPNYPNNFNQQNY